MPKGITNISNEASVYSIRRMRMPLLGGLTLVGDYAFAGCSSLTSVMIPENVTSIGECAFEDCSALSNVYYSGDEEQWENITVAEDKNDTLNSATVNYSHVHDYAEEEVIEPTCTENGYTDHTCICGDRYAVSYVDALGHSYVNCVCTRCGTEYPFTDVDTAGRHKPFADTIQWAAGEGITTGYNDGSFRPNATCTRWAVVLFMYRDMT